MIDEREPVDYVYAVDCSVKNFFRCLIEPKRVPKAKNHVLKKSFHRIQRKHPFYTHSKFDDHKNKYQGLKNVETQARIGICDFEISTGWLIKKSFTYNAL